MNELVANSPTPGQMAAPRRNRFFFGKLLTAHDLEMEQSYFNQKRWMLNQLGLGKGVLCGLRISAGEGQICIGPGAAVDGQGREIIVPRPVCLDPWRPTDECGRAGPPLSQEENYLVTICLAYHECPADYAPALVTNCNTAEACEAGAVVEGYQLLVRPGQPALPARTVDEALCTALFGPGQGNQTPAGRLQRLCQGLSETCPSPEDPCVVLGTVQLKAGGTVGEIDVCTARPIVLSNAALLELILCLAERVDECCAPPPAQPVQVAGVAFLGANNQVLRRLTNPSEAIQLRANWGLAAIRVEFTRAVDHRSLVAGEPNQNPGTFSFLVQGSGSDLPRNYLPGILTPEDDMATRFSLGPGMSFQPGEYRLTLFGDPSDQRPAVKGMDGLHLDGEPTGFPSGDGSEGGTFAIRFNIT